MADMTKLAVSMILMLVVFAFVVQLISDGNKANGAIYNTNYPTMAKISQYTSSYQNTTNAFHAQSAQNTATNGGSILGQFLNAVYNITYNITIATMSLSSFADIGSAMLQDAGTYFGGIPSIIMIAIGIYILFKIAMVIANATKGGPL